MKERTTVDTDIEQEDAGWEFDEAVAENFDTHVRKSIPNYDTIQQQTAKLTDWFVKGENTDRIYDLGCATGQTLELLAARHRGSPVQLVGIDVEEAMLDEARDRLEHEQHVTLTQRDIRDSPRFPNASVVVSLFTLSFIPESDRAAVLERVYDDLDRGGALIFCEKTRAGSAFFQDVFNEHYWDYKSSQGLTDDQILGKARTLRGQLRPLTETEYREMLTAAGFDRDRIEAWYRYYPWYGVVARK